MSSTLNKQPNTPDGVTFDAIAAQAAGLTDSEETLTAIRFALAEDIGSGDITTLATVDADARVDAEIVFKEAAVVAGLPVFRAVFAMVDPEVEVGFLVPEGALIGEPPTVVGWASGSARSILTAERTALNFLQRLSGIATTTRQFVERARASGIELLDTRKTTPGLRGFEKYAVRVGGGVSHRSGLYDAILIKDNHVRLAGGVSAAVERARKVAVGEKIEVETTTLAEVGEALSSRAEVILLDNMSPDLVRDAVKLIAGRSRIEVSGGVRLANIDDYLIAGVDAISVGALTHSCRSVDISLEVEI